MPVTTEPDYPVSFVSPSVSVSTGLPKRVAGSSVLLLPVVSTGSDESDDRGSAVIASAEPFLTADVVAEIEAGLRALDATGGSEQVHRLVVPSLPVSSVLAVGHHPARRRGGGAVAGQHRDGDHHGRRAARRRRLLGPGRGADPGRLPV